MIEEDVLQLQRKVIQASNEYMQMFSRSKLLLQENRAILNQIVGPSMANSKCITPTLTARIGPLPTTGKSQTLRSLQKLDKVQQVRVILDLLNIPQFNEDSIQEESSRCMYNAAKYAEEQEREQKEEEPEILHQSPRIRKNRPGKSPAKRAPLVERMQLDIKKREARKAEQTRLRIQKKQQEVMEMEKIRQQKHTLIRQKSARYLQRCSSRPVSTKRTAKAQCC